MTGKSVCLIVTAEITATTFYRGYLRFLSEAGWDVTLIAASNGHLEEFGRAEGVTTRDVQMRRDPSPVSDLMALIRLVRTLRQVRPDVIVTATPKAGLLGTFAGFLTGIPSRIYQLWGIRFETESGARRTMLKMLETLSIRFATQVVANSDSLAKRAVELNLLGGKPIIVLGPGSSHGVDLERFAPDAAIGAVDSETAAFLADAPDALVVGFVGRVHPDKGILTLIRALEICRDKGMSVRLLVVGAFESDFIVSQIQHSTVDTHLVGAVADTRPFFEVMDVHCLPTRREGFPNVVLEAAGMALATVASDATGAVDSVLDGQTGLLFPTDDADALADAIRSLFDRDLRHRLGQQARAHVERNFAKETIWRLQAENIGAQATKARTS